MVNVSKQEYLKKYLSATKGRSDSAKKQKKKNKNTGGRLKIVDSDAAVPLPEDLSKPPVEEQEVEEDGVAPVIAITEDVRVDELKMIGKFKTDTWQSLPETSSEHRRHDSESGEDDNSPPRARHDSSSDDDPVQKRDLDLSPRRPDSADPDNSPPRQKHSDQDFSPERGGKSDSDASPPRKAPHRSRRSVTPEVVESDGNKKLSKTLSGKSAGLQSAKQLREESEKLKRKEQKMFHMIDDSVSGRNAETVFRDRGTGKRRNLKEEKKLTEEQIKKQQELEEKYKLWNKGVKQVEGRKQRLDEMVKEASKPLARYEGDQDLETHLKQQEMKEDPMLDYMRKKRTKVNKMAGISQFPKYSGPPPPQNRFNILPGYRWDGVNRSNGFEQKLFTASNLKKADQEEYYKWTMGTYE